MGKELTLGGGRDLLSYAFSEEEKDLIKNTVAPGQNLTDAEFLLFAYVCKRRGLDCFLRQVIPVKFKDHNTGKENLSFITSIDAFRAIAQRTGQFGGSSDYLFDEGLNQYQFLSKWKEKLRDKGKIVDEDEILIHPHTASCTVIKIIGEHKIETTATARWKEYYPAHPGRQFHWNRMPFNMLGKCAEALALRKGFPFDLSGLYIDAEMDQAIDAKEASYSLENNDDLVREVEEGYSILGWNEAKRIQYTSQNCGADLHHASRPALEGLVELLKKEVDKLEI